MEYRALFARNRREKSALALGVVIAVGVAMALTGSSGASVSTVSGSAYGESVDVTPLGLARVTSGPLPTVTLPPAGGGPFTNSLISVTVPASGPNPGSILTAGVLNVRTQGATGETGFAESSADVADVNVLNSLVTATAVHSECRSDSSGSTGSTQLLGLKAGKLTGDVSPAPNTTIQLPGATVILNEQIENEQPGSSSITVNAIHVILRPPLGSGDIIIAQSHCDVAGPNVNQTTTSTSSQPTTSTTSGPTTSTSSTTSTTVEPTTTTTSSSTTTTTSPQTPSTTTTTVRSTTTTTVAPTTTTNPKCNAGQGNGSEPLPSGGECDPGNSGGHNQGGD